MRLKWFYFMALAVVCGCSDYDAANRSADDLAVPEAHEQSPAVAADEQSQAATTDEQSPAVAADGGSISPPMDEATRKEKIEELLDDFSDESEEFQLAYLEKNNQFQEAILDDEDTTELKDQIVQLRGGFYAKVQVICEKIFQLAQLKPADEDSLAAFSFILKNRGPSKIGLKSLAYVMEHHYDSPMLQPVIKYASYNLDKKTETMLETISKKSKSEEIRAAALFALIDFYVNLKKAQKMPKEDLSESYDAEFVSNYDEESIDVDPIWDRLVDEFGDLYHQGNPIDEYVPIARHLAVGATAPDIEGPDMYGEKFKLSDYRGKVVLLDFWGDW